YSSAERTRVTVSEMPGRNGAVAPSEPCGQKVTLSYRCLAPRHGRDAKPLGYAKSAASERLLTHIRDAFPTVPGTGGGTRRRVATARWGNRRRLPHRTAGSDLLEL